MSGSIDFKILISDLTVRMTCEYKQTFDFCEDYLTEREGFDLWVTSNERDTLGEISRHGGEGTLEYYEKIYLYRQIAEKLPAFNRFVFHGACVEVGGQGYIFTAPPGTGKSTHAALLLKHFGESVSIINGDKPILKVEEDKITVCSCPWSGKEGWQRNTSAPLGGIVLLARGEQNSIRKIAPSDYLERLILQAYAPEDPEGFLKTLELLDKVSRLVPFYLLECDISKEAAATSYKMMTKG